MPMIAADASRSGEGVGRGNIAPHLNREEQLIRDAQTGDVRAFNELVRGYQARAYRLAYRVLSDEAAASDATQEAFISAYRHLGALRGDSFGPWLTRIVTNACYDQLRKKQKQHAVSLEALFADPDAVAPRLAQAGPPSPQELVERQELNDVIQLGIADLPFDQRVTVVLADIEGYSYEQIAELTHANIGTVKSRLARGRGGLRAFLQAEEGLLPTKYRRSRD